MLNIFLTTFKFLKVKHPILGRLYNKFHIIQCLQNGVLDIFPHPFTPQMSPYGSKTHFCPILTPCLYTYTVPYPKLILRSACGVCFLKGECKSKTVKREIFLPVKELVLIDKYTSIRFWSLSPFWQCSSK